MRKQCCLLTSGTGPDLHNHITHIVGILGQQQKFYLLPQLLYVRKGRSDLFPGARLKIRFGGKLLRRLQIPLTLLQSSPDFDQRRKFFLLPA